MKLYQDQFSDHYNQARTAAPPRTILIASTPRCGSHMLGHAMTETSRLGVPFEYMNPSNLLEWQNRLDTSSPQETLRALMNIRTSANGVFCIKAHYSHCAIFGGVEAFLSALPNLCVVHIRRADVLRQAISYSIAEQTGVWISGQEQEAETSAYQPKRINRCLNSVATQNANWVTAFRKNNIAPLNIFYEDMEADLQATVDKVARFAGVIDESDSLPTAPRTTRQSSAQRSDEWVARYQRDSQASSVTIRRIRNKIKKIFPSATAVGSRKSA